MPDEVVAGEGLEQRAGHEIENHVEVVFLPQATERHKVVACGPNVLKPFERRVLFGKVPAFSVDIDRCVIHCHSDRFRRYAVPALHLARQNELAVLLGNEKFALVDQLIDARCECLLRFAPIAVLRSVPVQINARVVVFHDVQFAAVKGVKAVVVVTIADRVLIFALEQAVLQQHVASVFAAEEVDVALPHAVAHQLLAVVVDDAQLIAAERFLADDLLCPTVVVEVGGRQRPASVALRRLCAADDRAVAVGMQLGVQRGEQQLALV